MPIILGGTSVLSPNQAQEGGGSKPEFLQEIMARHSTCPAHSSVLDSQHARLCTATQPTF